MNCTAGKHRATRHGRHRAPADNRPAAAHSKTPRVAWLAPIGLVCVAFVLAVGAGTALQPDPPVCAPTPRPAPATVATPATVTSGTNGRDAGPGSREVSPPPGRTDRNLAPGRSPDAPQGQSSPRFSGGPLASSAPTYTPRTRHAMPPPAASGSATPSWTPASETPVPSPHPRPRCKRGGRR